jgi:hypothetical protein
MKEFSFTFDKGLKVGLRANKRNPRGQEALIKAQGVIPEDGALCALEDISSQQIDTSALNCTFPYPQIFTLTQLTLVCTPTEIYQYESGVLTLLYTCATAGYTWTFADYGNYIVLTNGNHIVIREGLSGDWTEQSDSAIPLCACLCDVNGQLIVGGLWAVNDQGGLGIGGLGVGGYGS